MTLQDIIQKLNLSVFTKPVDFSSTRPTGGYAADLLSCVMAKARPGNIWVTLQSHINIVAVAALTEASAVIITEGAVPETDLLEKADSQGVTLLGTTASTYEVAGRLWELGLHQ